MATKEPPYFLSPKEFLVKACRKLEIQLSSDYPKFKIYKKKIGKTITVSFSLTGEEPEEGTSESETACQIPGRRSGDHICLRRIYLYMFLENPTPPAKIFDSMLEEYVNGVKKCIRENCVSQAQTTLKLTEVKERILPYVKTTHLFDSNNKQLPSSDIKVDTSIVAFPLIGIPATRICVSINNGLYKINLTKDTVQEWCKDPDSSALLESYTQKADPQLEKLIDRKETVKEEVALLKLARENLLEKIRKQGKECSIWKETTSVNCFETRFRGLDIEFNELLASVVMIPEEISALEVNGDHVVLLAERDSVIVGQSQDAMSLCYMGDFAFRYRKLTFHVAFLPLRLVNCGEDLWKWTPYEPDLSKNEAIVPRNMTERDDIFCTFDEETRKGAKKGKVINVPVFVEFPTPLSFESQEKFANLTETKNCYANFRSMCWRCGKSFSENLRKCKQCLMARYCGPECQKAHWKLHKRFCMERKLKSDDASQVKEEKE